MAEWLKVQILLPPQTLTNHNQHVSESSYHHVTVITLSPSFPRRSHTCPPPHQAAALHTDT